MKIGKDAKFTEPKEIYNCYNCKYYLFFDSGYGYCTLNPPIPIYGFKFKLKFPFIFFGIKDFDYVLVPWCLHNCSKFVTCFKK